MLTRASQRKYHVIYKTICLSTGRYYIGMHSTDDLNDGYKGSGQRLWKSIKKYGADQHHCVILEHHPDRETLSKREEQLVNTDLLQDPMCMNLRTGGTGNYPGMTTSDSLRQKRSQNAKKMHAELTQEQREHRSLAISKANKLALSRQEAKSAQSEAAKKRWEDPVYRELHTKRLRNQKHTEEAKMKMSLAKTGKKLLRTPEHNAKIAAAHRARVERLKKHTHE